MITQALLYTYVMVGKLPLLNYVYVTVLYTALTISNEEMCKSHLHIHDIVHKVYNCTIPLDNVIAS